MAQEFSVLKEHILAVQVCSSLSLDETLERLTAEVPTGVESPWSLGDKAACGPNPVACAKYPSTHKHYVFVY